MFIPPQNAPPTSAITTKMPPTIINDLFTYCVPFCPIAYCVLRNKNTQYAIRTISLVSQRFNRVEAGGPAGGVYPEEYTYRYREAYRQQPGHGCHHRSYHAAQGHYLRGHYANRQAYQATAGAQRHSLNQELAHYISALRSHRLADTYLASSLGHGHQHDVHDADAAHQQRDPRNGTQEEGQHRSHSAQRAQQVRLVEHREVVIGGGHAVALA